MKIRLCCIVLVVALSLASAGAAFPQSAEPSPPDTLLVLKNGAEVRGLFVEMRDGTYTLRLPDGRVLTYAVADVERMEKLAPAASAPEPTAPSAAPIIDPATCRVFISEKGLPVTHYTAIRDIKVSKKWYGSTTEMFGQLAAKARTVRADGVIDVRTWHAPSGFSWAAPHAGGMAIKWTDVGRKALPTLEGRCY